MAQPIGPNQQFMQLIAKFEHEKKMSQQRIDQIISETGPIALLKPKNTEFERVRNFELLVDEQLPEVESLQELSKLVSGFLESLNQELITRQEVLNSAYGALSKAKGINGIGELFSFQHYYLQEALKKLREAPAEDIPERAPTPAKLQEVDLGPPAPVVVDTVAIEDLDDDFEEVSPQEATPSPVKPLEQEEEQIAAPSAGLDVSLRNALFDLDAKTPPAVAQ